MSDLNEEPFPGIISATMRKWPEGHEKPRFEQHGPVMAAHFDGIVDDDGNHLAVVCTAEAGDDCNDQDLYAEWIIASYLETQPKEN